MTQDSPLTYQLTASDYEGFEKLGLSNNTILRLREYLKKYDLQVKVDRRGDMWHFCNFVIEGIDLTINGSNLSDKIVNNFIDTHGRTKKHPCWVLLG